MLLGDISDWQYKSLGPVVPEPAAGAALTAYTGFEDVEGKPETIEVHAHLVECWVIVEVETDMGETDTRLLPAWLDDTGDLMTPLHCREEDGEIFLGCYRKLYGTEFHDTLLKKAKRRFAFYYEHKKD